MSYNTTEIANRGQVLILPVAAATKIEQGSLVALSGGYAIPAKKAASLIAVGRAETFAENQGANGDEFIEVKRGAFLWDNDGTIKETHIMSNCYIVDDHTVTATATGSSVAGKVLMVTTEGVAVETY